MKKICVILLLFVVVTSGCLQQLGGVVEVRDQSVSGVIWRDSVWSGTILVTGDVFVAEGVTLTILPGTIVKVSAFSDDQHGGVDHPRDPPFPKDSDRLETQSTQIIIGGTLNAVGTPDKKIVFTSDSVNPTTYDWDGLIIARGRLDYAVVEYARYNNIQESSDVVIANSVIRNSLECCLCIGHSKPVSPKILYNEVYNCGHEGIDYAGGSGLIKGNYFHLENAEIQPDPSIGRGGIVVYENAYPVIEDNVFRNLSNALLFLPVARHNEEGGKKVLVKNNSFEKNAVGIEVEGEYPFDEGVVLENNTMVGNKKDVERR